MKTMTRIVKAFGLAVILALSAHTSTSAQTTPVDVLRQVRALIDSYLSTLTDATTPIVVTGRLQSALNNAPSGATLQLPPNYSEPSSLTVMKSVTIVGVADATSGALPKLSGGVTVLGDNKVNVKLTNVELRRTQDRSDIVPISGTANVTLTNVHCLGDALLGQKRCVAANGGAFTMHDSICDDIFAVGQDTQCIAAWDSAGPFDIQNNFLRAAGENVLFGGADPSSPDRVPADGVIRNNTLTKKLSWKGSNVQVKNLLEIKNGKRFLIEKNILEYNFSGAQAGWAVLFTPRNQDGRAPYSNVEDIIFQLNTIRHSVAAFQISGDDNEHPSGRLRGLKVLKNITVDIDPKAWRGVADPTDQMILIVRGPTDVTFDGNDFSGRNLGSIYYFDEAPPKVLRLTVTNNAWPSAYWGIVLGGNSSPDLAANGLPRAWNDYVDPLGSLFASNTTK